MNEFQMYRMTVIAPAVTNDGHPSDYASGARSALRSVGIDGWTENETAGVWRGRRESGTRFEVFLPAMPRPAVPAQLGEYLRHAMPDQEAIQVTIEPAPVHLFEY